MDTVSHEVSEVENINGHLLKWPIIQLTLEDGSKLMDHYQEDDILVELHEQDTLSSSHVDPTKVAQGMRKRNYRMLNRKPLLKDSLSELSKTTRLLMSESLFLLLIVVIKIVASM